MFITFTKQKEYLIDNIQNGFLLRNHQISFSPSIEKFFSDLLPIWRKLGFRTSVMDDVLKMEENSNGDLHSFLEALIPRLKEDFSFLARLSLEIGYMSSSVVKMKCFTEIRGNQKVNTEHVGDFGRYGIMMRSEWMLKNGAPVIYVDKECNLTNAIAKNLSLLKTFDSYVQSTTKVKSADVFFLFIELFAYFETSEHRHEYEWRVVHPEHNGENNFQTRLPFSLKDIESIFVNTDEDIEELKSVLSSVAKTRGEKSSHIPSILKTDDILLTKEEMFEIKKIYSRGL